MLCALLSNHLGMAVQKTAMSTNAATSKEDDDWLTLFEAPKPKQANEIGKKRVMSNLTGRDIHDI